MTEPSHRSLRERAARRIGRFLGISTLFAKVQELMRSVDALRADLEELREQVRRFEGRAPLGSPPSEPASDRADPAPSPEGTPPPP